MSEGPVTATRLVGRERDLEALTATLRTVQAGRMAAVVLCGEAGAGKTSLVEELAARAEADGAIVLSGGALDIAESPPFWPIAAALRSLVASGDPRAAAALALWREPLEELLALGDGRGDPAVAQAAPGAGQTLELVRRVVADLARRAPVVLVVEDLQWVDHSTRDLLVYLIANLTADPVLLLVTCRVDADPDTSAGHALIAELQRHRQVRCAEVTPLSRVAVAQIVAQAAPGRPELVDLVWSRSRGNAFIVGETLRAALEGDPNALPGTLRDLVLSRLATLSPRARQVVRIVAAAHGPLPHHLLATVAADLRTGGPELLDALREAAERGVVVVDDSVSAGGASVGGASVGGASVGGASVGGASAGGASAGGGDAGGGYRLRHGLMTDVVTCGLLPGERIAVHRAYATALERRRARGQPGVHARLAHHWQQAGDLPRALAAAVAAARAATRVHGHAEAHRHWLRAALLAADVLPRDVGEGRPDDGGTGSGDTAAGDVPSRAECLEQAAEAAHLAGDHDQAVGLLGECLDETPDGGTPDAVRHARLHTRTGRYLQAAGRGAEAAHAYRRAIRLLPADARRERAEVACGQAAALLHAGEYTASQAAAREALALVREVGPAREEARVLVTLGFGLAYLEDTAAGSAALTEALAVAERAGGPAEVARAYAYRAELLAGPLNEMERGIAVAREGLERVRALGLDRSAGVGLLSLVANGLFRLGRWDEATTALREAWALRPTGAAAIELRLARCKVDMAQGRLDAAEDDLEAVDMLVTGTVGPRYRVPLLTLRAGLEMWRGRPDLALEHVEAGLDVVERGCDDVWVVAPLMWHGARARAEIAARGLRPAGPAVAARLRRHVVELADRAAGLVPAVRDVVLAFVAMIEAEDTRVDGPPSPEAWADVVRRWERHQQPYPAAYAALRRAEAAFAVRARSASGADALRRAERAASAIGAVPLLAEIRELAEHARVPLREPPTLEEVTPADAAPPGVPAPRTADPLDALTGRELEVLVVLAGGLTNREIAGRLFIAEKTVGVHVGRIYQKLGVRGRVQATSLFRRARPDGPPGPGG